MRYLSLCSGIEAASLAWEPLGWTPAAFAEVDPAACAVLTERWPHIPNLGDVKAINRKCVGALGPIDLVVFGSPCQDLSIAGKRGGLNGERSGIFFDAMRVVHLARTVSGCRWALWENVEGALWSRKGGDFSVVAGALAGANLGVPTSGWQSGGAGLGRWLVEWRVLDAQFFGVPQRRRRVFALADFGAWAGRGPVLLEPEGVCWNPASRRTAAAGIAPTITSGSKGSGGFRLDDAEIGGLIVGSPPTIFQERGIAFHGSQDPDISGEVTPAIGRNYGREACMAFDPTQITSRANGSHPRPGNPAPTLARTAHPPTLVMGGEEQTLQVRRITPREAERLMGMPDDHTLVPYRGRPMVDGPRYRLIGNSMAVPCIRWIGERIQRCLAVRTS